MVSHVHWFVWLIIFDSCALGFVGTNFSLIVMGFVPLSLHLIIIKSQSPLILAPKDIAVSLSVNPMS